MQRQERAGDSRWDYSTRFFLARGPLIATVSKRKQRCSRSWALGCSALATGSKEWQWARRTALPPIKMPLPPARSPGFRVGTRRVRRLTSPTSCRFLRRAHRTDSWAVTWLVHWTGGLPRLRRRLGWPTRRHARSASYGHSAPITSREGIATRCRKH